MTSNLKGYIIDSGVAYHSDLGNVTHRVSVACGNDGDCSGVEWCDVNGYSLGKY